MHNDKCPEKSIDLIPEESMGSTMFYSASPVPFEIKSVASWIQSYWSVLDVGEDLDISRGFCGLKVPIDGPPKWSPPAIERQQRKMISLFECRFIFGEKS